MANNINRFTILCKYGADCRTWVQTVTSQYPEEEGRKETVFAIQPNVDYPILLTRTQAQELKERLDSFLKNTKEVEGCT